MKKALLDTSGYSNLLKGDKDIQTEIEKASTIYLSVVVIGELLSAFKNGRHETRNKNLLEKFILKQPVIVCEVSSETAEIYAQISNFLKKKGALIPVDDIWIAASAMETGSVLITYDSHFTKIAGLRIWDILKN